jgi:hypothetical protein
MPFVAWSKRPELNLLAPQNVWKDLAAIERFCERNRISIRCSADGAMATSSHLRAFSSFLSWLCRRKLA